MPVGMLRQVRTITREQFYFDETSDLSGASPSDAWAASPRYRLDVFQNARSCPADLFRTLARNLDRKVRFYRPSPPDLASQQIKYRSHHPHVRSLVVRIYPADLSQQRATSQQALFLSLIGRRDMQSLWTLRLVAHGCRSRD
jgi:hypothetical protein